MCKFIAKTRNKTRISQIYVILEIFQILNKKLHIFK